MPPILTTSFCDPFIDKLMKHIDAEDIAKGKAQEIKILEDEK